MAQLIRRSATDRDPALAAAVREIELVGHGRYGENRPDLQATVALAKSAEVVIVDHWRETPDSPAELIDAAADMVNEIESVHGDRDTAIVVLKEIRSAVSREIAKERRRGLPYRTVSVALAQVEVGRYEGPSAIVTIEVIGPTLDLTHIWFEAENAEHVSLGFANIREDQESLLALRRTVLERNADLMIEAPILSVLQEAGVDLDATIEALRREGGHTIYIKVRHGRLLLYANNGVVAGVAPLGRGISWRDGDIDVPKSWGITASQATGVPLNQLLSTDYFATELRADHAVADRNGVRIRARPAPVALKLGESRKAA